MQCPCGGETRTHQVKAGTAHTCNGCGRYEVMPPRWTFLPTFSEEKKKPASNSSRHQPIR